MRMDEHVGAAIILANKAIASQVRIEFHLPVEMRALRRELGRLGHSKRPGIGVYLRAYPLARVKRAGFARMFDLVLAPTKSAGKAHEKDRCLQMKK
jgi:hypothetical protein